MGSTVRHWAPQDRQLPAVRRGIVARRDLFEKLAGGRRVVHLSAPPGSGKTVLLRSWIDEAELADHTAWVSVPGDERDPQRFWILVADAIRRTALGSRVVKPLAAAHGLDVWVIVEHLLGDLGRLEDRIWLVIDDLQELRSDDGLRQLELFLMRAPGTLRFVLAARHDLRLGLHRLRLEEELTEVRAADLRFRSAEARSLFQAAGVELSDPALQILLERTEGWAAGLRMAALSLRGHADPERFAAEFSGIERTVADYLLAEVLERQPEHTRRLLLRTSILERVNAPLADLLTEGTGAERVLQQLEEANAFVVSLDARRSWFRYRPLFADLLQLELRRTSAGEIRGLHLAAGGWLADHGYPIEAIRHAQAAEDWGLAARLLSEHWFDFYFSGQGGRAHDLVTAFPPGAAAVDAELAALMAADQLYRGPLDRVERHLAAATRLMDSMPVERRANCEVVLASVRLALARQRGDLPAAVEESQRLLARPGSPMAAHIESGYDLRAHALVSLGTTELWSARIDDAERHLEEGFAIARQARRPFLEIYGLTHLAMAASLRSPSLAVERGMQAIELARRYGWSEEWFIALGYIVVGVTMVWQGRLEEAESWLVLGERALRPEAQPAPGRLLYYGRGWRALALGRNREALTAFQAAEQQAQMLADPLATPTYGYMLQALLRVEGPAAVEHALSQLDERARERGEMRIAIAALGLVRGEFEAATAALANVLDGSARLTNSRVWLIQAFLLEAVARDALGEVAAADLAVEQALDLAEPDGFLLPFLVQPTPDLLERHVRRRTSHASLVSEILNLVAGRKPASAQVDEQARREPLSESERRILRYLPTNLSVPEIAGQTYLSVNTVKTHMRHVYDKLGAHRRSEAVERARAFGLLAPSALSSGVASR